MVFFFLTEKERKMPMMLKQGSSVGMGLDLLPSAEMYIMCVLQGQLLVVLVSASTFLKSCGKKGQIPLLGWIAPF